MKITGKVWLVGAGPGEVALLTLKALHCIRHAQTIVYDRLINPELLALAPAECELINVGKDPGHHPIPQHKINALLIEHAGQNRQVVRLKGGDPYIFGRGAEEAESLVDAGIPFEVVPGVSSTTGGLACAGISVTHREYASSFHVVTGHPGDGNHQQDWHLLAKLNGTLVIVMGISNLAWICQELLAGGKAPETPAAIVMSATLQNQRRLTGTLGGLVSLAQEAKVTPPALIVIGDVVRLSDRLSSLRCNVPLPSVF